MSTENNGNPANTILALPVHKKDRILFLDCVRGLALLGILLMNSMAQSQSHIFYDNMNVNQSLTGPNFYVWVMERGIFEGTMRGLFSILFGAGTYLLISRLARYKTGLEPADIYFRRITWLLVFGCFNAFILLWPGDILYPYALCGFLLFPFRNLVPRKLVIGALLLLALGTYRENSQLFEGKETLTKGIAADKLSKAKQQLSETQDEDLKKYEKLKEELSIDGKMKAAEKDNKAIQGKSYLEIFRYYKDVNMMLQSTFFYNSWWDILMMFFVGIALLRNGFLEGKQSTAMYLAVAVVGIGAGILLNYYQLRLEYTNRFDGIAVVQQQKFSYYEIRRVLQTLGYLSVLVLLYKVRFFQKVLKVFAPVGQMAFTNYLSQSIITSIIFYGLGWFGKLQRYEVYYVVVAIWVFQIITSAIWLRYFLFGPFEWLWRSLTYKKRQPMLRGAQSLTPESAAGVVAG